MLFKSHSISEKWWRGLAKITCNSIALVATIMVTKLRVWVFPPPPHLCEVVTLTDAKANTKTWGQNAFPNYRVYKTSVQKQCEHSNRNWTTGSKTLQTQMSCLKSSWEFQLCLEVEESSKWELTESYKLPIMRCCDWRDLVPSIKSAWSCSRLILVPSLIIQRNSIHQKWMGQ